MYSSQQYRSGGGDVKGDHPYSGSYDILPSDRPYRTLPRTPKPRIYGIQTAKVVGKKGEENEDISTDEHGHIWVQFHWDREPQKSCPVRVAQTWAGKGWGTIFLPRVGMEVVVDFLEGDPDRPLVSGCVYNGDNRVPYDLPANKTIAGIKSNSTKSGSGYNELNFEDNKGSERIGLHAQKDYNVVVLDTETREIGENFTAHSGAASRNTTVKLGDDQLTVAAGNQTVKIALNQMTEAGIGITLQVGASSIEITPASITLIAPSISIMSTAPVPITPAAVTNVIPPV